jgi:hypothetical protein
MSTVIKDSDKTVLISHYNILHTEINKAGDANHVLLYWMAGLVGGVIAFGLSNPGNIWIFVVGFIITTFGHSVIVINRRCIWRIASYISVFVEPYLDYIKWEQRLNDSEKKGNKADLTSWIIDHEFMYVNVLNLILCISFLINLYYQPQYCCFAVMLPVSILLFSSFFIYSLVMNRLLQRNNSIHNKYLNHWKKLKEQEETEGLAQKTDKRKTFVQGADWIFHVEKDLMPFWLMDEALGSPVGNFPTFRLNDGRLGVPPDMPDWVNDQSNTGKQDFLRMKSRQIFAYSTAYHLTGKEIYLKYAKAGVDYLRSVGMYKGGCPISYWEETPPENIMKPDGDPLMRTSQDLAYSINCLAMYYYLTREETVLKDILKVKNYIFETYFDKSTINQDGTKLFQWVKKDSKLDNTQQKELVAILDQLNAYLVLLASILPYTDRIKFVGEMEKLCNMMKDHFYYKPLNIFWGKLHDKQFGLGTHTDFGHSIKAFWMCYLVGNLSHNQSLTSFGKQNAERLFAKAFIPSTGSWGSHFENSKGKVSENKCWWVYAELDQMAATLSLQDDGIYAKYLENTYSFWFKKFVDQQYHEVWHSLNSQGEPDKSIPKIHHWKNGYHSHEHALIGYLSTCQYVEQPVRLYYAFRQDACVDDSVIQPYYFRGKIVDKTKTGFNLKDFPSLGSYDHYCVQFENIH